MVRSRSFIATPPGATIKEQLSNRGMSQKEFAIRMDMTEKHISRLINGEVALTPNVAIRLEMVLGIPASFWINLEAIYREKLAKANAENEMDKDIEISKKLPYTELVKNNWVPKAHNQSEKVVCLRQYFEVTKLSLIDNFKLNQIACRRLSETEKSDYALIAWAQKAKLEARGMKTRPINIKGLRSAIPEIRKMTRQMPSEFCPELITLLQSYGVALVFLPHIGGSFLHGATFYDGDKIVIGLTVRGRYADKFWFSLFHELAHIIYGHIGQPNGTTDQDESLANEFAKNTLINEVDFNRLVSQGNFSKSALISFASSIDIDVGIVVGRLQKEGIIGYNWHNDLKTMYAISA